MSLAAVRPEDSLAWYQRARYVAGKGRGHRHEMMVKLISKTRSRIEAGNLVRYVARLRKEDVYEPRQEVKRGDGSQALSANILFKEGQERIAGLLEEFDLEKESDNLTAAGRLKSPILFHFTVSYPEVKDELEVAAAVEATERAIADAFDSAGYPSLWVMHNCPAATHRKEDDLVMPVHPAHTGDPESFRASFREPFRQSVPASFQEPFEDGNHAKLHAHILVRARNNNPYGKRLSFNRQDLEELRAIFTGYGQGAGLKVHMSRKIDRADMHEQVIADVTGLKSSDDFNKYPGKKEPPKRGDPAWRAPVWQEWVRYDPSGSVAGRRRSALIDELQERNPVLKQEETALDMFSRHFEKPEQAYLRWQLFRAELKQKERRDKLAYWYLKNRPETFGAITGRPGERDLRLLVQQGLDRDITIRYRDMFENLAAISMTDVFRNIVANKNKETPYPPQTENAALEKRTASRIVNSLDSLHNVSSLIFSRKTRRNIPEEIDAVKDLFVKNIKDRPETAAAGGSGAGLGHGGLGKPDRPGPQKPRQPRREKPVGRSRGREADI